MHLQSSALPTTGTVRDHQGPKILDSSHERPSGVATLSRASNAEQLADAGDLGQLHRSVELAKARRTSSKHCGDLTILVQLCAEVSSVALAALAVLAVSPDTPTPAIVTFAALFVVVRLVRGTVRPRLLLSVVQDLGREISNAVLAAGGSLVVLTVTGAEVDMPALAGVGLAFLGATLVCRSLAFAVLRRVRSRPSMGRRTLVIGAGPEGRHVAEGLLARPQLGLTPVGFLDVETVANVPLSPALPLLGRDVNELADLIVEHGISTVIATFIADDDELVDVMLTSTRLDTQIFIVPRLYELASDNASTEWIEGIPLVRHTSGVTSRPSWRVKRIIDVAVAGASLLLLAPVLVGAAVAVLVDSGRPILFRQRRIGIDGVPFELFKFRSMRPASEHEQQTTWNIAKDPRVGRIGKFLRRSSIDELPQLFNILRGEMSLVGPRPERPAFVEQFSAEHSRYWARHRLPVGLTGWAQVNGLRGDTSIAQRARFDNFYIANWSLWLDLKIMLLTVREVVRGSGR